MQPLTRPRAPQLLPQVGARQGPRPREAVTIVGLSGCLCHPGAARLEGKSPPIFNPFHFRASLSLLLLWDAFSLYWEGCFLHHSSCKKILCKKCIHTSVPLAGPLSKQSSAFCVAAEVKSQLVTGSKSRRASGHACGHPPGEMSHVWANSFEPTLLYDFTPHSSPSRNSLSNASEKDSTNAC